jgi:hypothetical protein
MAALRVRVRSSQKTYRHGEAINLAVSVENLSSKSLFVVTAPSLRHYGPPYMWRKSSRSIGVMLAEAELAPGLCYYGYMPPTMVSLPARRKRVIPLHVGMPLREGRIENNAYIWAETPISGQVKIDVTVGYLRSKLQPQSPLTWAEFVALQETVSAQVAVRINRK